MADINPWELQSELEFELEVAWDFELVVADEVVGGDGDLDLDLIRGLFIKMSLSFCLIFNDFNVFSATFAFSNLPLHSNLMESSSISNLVDTTVRNVETVHNKSTSKGCLVPGSKMQNTFHLGQWHQGERQWDCY